MRNQISILALDLGKNLGWARCTCIFRPELRIDVIQHGTENIEKMANERMGREYNEVYSIHRVMMNIHEEVIRKLTNIVKFDSFVTEDVFCKFNQVSAFRKLAVYMEILERIVNTEHQKRLYTVPPTLIKKHIDNYGHADKSLVQQAILNNHYITMKNPDKATSHEFDAVAGCWAAVHEYLMTPV